jgi:3-polyprenyl-4-hydroxybenzoate decarboxylase
VIKTNQHEATLKTNKHNSSKYWFMQRTKKCSGKTVQGSKQANKKHTKHTKDLVSKMMTGSSRGGLPVLFSFTVPSWRDPTMEYQVKIRRRPALNNWSKVARFLRGEETVNSTRDGTSSTGNASTSIRLQMNDHDQVAVRHSPSCSSLDEASSMEECGESLGVGFVPGVQVQILTGTGTPFCPNWGELEIASIRAMIARDDDTTDSEIQIVEQLKERQPVRTEGNNDTCISP